MAETATIGEMAEVASDRIFSVFGWERYPLINQNFDCVDKVRHKKQRKSPTHPVDCVFNYVDPYTARSTFVNTDLKSYAVSTLEAADIPKAVRNLGHSVECANRSDEWKKLFLRQERNHDVVGMLFIYNHDGEYDKSFNEKLAAIPPSSFELLPETFVGVVGPHRVSYLNSVAQDIKALHSDGKLPGKENRFFFYPHLNRTPAFHQHHTSATLPALLSPLLILTYKFPEGFKFADGKAPASSNGLYAYYDGKGESIHEFKYLLGYLFKYQLVTEGTDIFISLAQPARDAAVSFDNAKRQHAREYWPYHGAVSEQECLQKFESIKYRSIPNFQMRFSDRELGMHWPEA